MKKIMLIYPPGKPYQRGEDRCQLNISKSCANSIRACNDLGYVSAVLKKRGYKIFLKDYQGEKLSLDDLLSDVKNQKPDVVFLSTTNATIFDDIEILKEIKKINPETVIILKGAIFFNCSEDLLSKIDIDTVDYLISAQEEFIIGDLIDFHYNSKDKLSEIPFIFYKENGKFQKSKDREFFDDLDSIPFPDRDEMNNDLYLMPDTGEKLATISASRGCPSSCIFCLSPVISGKKARFRSADNILKELEECYFKFKIRNFFFKADTFTIDRKRCVELCEKILNSKLKGKINWVANSRVNTLDMELLKLMKKAGCSLIALGLESGSDESLDKMKKNTTQKQNYKAVKMIKKAGLKSFGFYVMGFPWEDFSHFELTKKAMFKNDTDFIELHIATPFYGTEFYNMLQIKDEIYGKDHFSYINAINKDLDPKEVEKFRQKAVLEYYLRPSYLIKKITYGLLRPKVLVNYLRYGIRLILNFLKASK